MELSVQINSQDEIRLLLRKSDDLDNKYFLIDSENEQIYIELEYNESGLVCKKCDSNVTEPEERLKEKLDELALKIIELEQSGIEDSEISDAWEEGKERPYDPEKIRVDPKSFSLKQIFEMIKDGDIDLNPNFQRNFVWDNVRKSRLIESILLKIPLPIFYFSQDDDGKISVVDGLQRLSTIRDFMENKLKLNKLEYLDKCNLKYYSKEGQSVEPKYYRWFNMTQIVANVIDPSSPSKVKYDIFRRINTGGKPLNSQEIRNCLASDKVRELLKSMVGVEFKNTTLGSVKETRMEDQELALRFIAFYQFYKKSSNLEDYSGKIEPTLNDKIDELSRMSQEELDSYLELFENAMLNAKYLFGKFAFRKCSSEHLKPKSKRQLINKAIFVSWSVILADYPCEDIKSTFEKQLLIKPLVERIDEKGEFYRAITYGTNGKSNIQIAFKAAKDIIENHLG